ncbi:hypothetical protein [Nesterenkonia sp. CF4.4]|uniref:variant leucine-rich repeat-containing protein n=1 Tax=Nesterenkonia sp. CF4.4 TaxID=3373079 RepID=UPI003EE5EAA5
MTDGPHHGRSSTGPDARAADPNTPQVQLQMLAGDHPELRPLIAQNPNTYPALLQWLSELGDPAVDAALARRSARAGSETNEFSAVRDDHDRRYAPRDTQYPSVQGYNQHYVHPPRQSHPPSQPRPGYYPAAPTGPTPRETQAAPSSYAEPERQPRRRGGGICAILFLLLLIVGAGAVAAYFLLFNGLLSGDEDPADETSVSEQGAQQQTEDQGQAEDETPAPEDGTAEDDAEAVRPAPEGAQDIPAFTAPSGNINCAIGEDELACSILDYSFETPQDCEGPARLSIGSEDPQLDCGSTGGEDSATLQYGQSATNGRFACNSSESGVECWNTETGNGFFMARESYQLRN